MTVSYLIELIEWFLDLHIYLDLKTKVKLSHISKKHFLTAFFLNGVSMIKITPGGMSLMSPIYTALLLAFFKWLQRRWQDNYFNDGRFYNWNWPIRKLQF